MNISNADTQLNQCSGCGICAVTCPYDCITVSKNKNGFFEAAIDNSKCIDCGLCKKFCYKYYKRPNEFHHAFSGTPVYAVWSKNSNFLGACSSGGFSTELANAYFERGYRICGVVYDNELGVCKHIIATESNDIEKFIGSKYLQSFTVDAFSQFKPQEKYVVFGTPCQIFGLRQYICFKNMENNFILVDFFCHGIPSYNMWIKYLDTLRLKGAQQIEQVNFVSKYKGWHNRSIVIKYNRSNEYKSSYKHDLFGILYGGRYCHNIACFDCPFRIDIVYSDIRVGDFWGDRFKSNQLGVNILTVNTEIGKAAFHKIRDALHIENATFDDLKNSKPWRFYNRPLQYYKIMSELRSDKGLYAIFNVYIRPFLFIERFLHRLNRIWKRLNN